MRRTWMPADDARLRELAEQRLHWREIAPLINRSEVAVRNRASDIGIRMHPELISRINAETAAKRNADPLYRMRHRMGCRRRKNTPETVEKMRKSIAIASAILRANPEHEAKRLAALGDGIRRGVAKRFAWCPPEYRPQYNALSKRGFPVVEAKRIVLEQIEKDRRTAKRAQTFADELARVASGQSRVFVLPTRAPALDGRA